MPPIVSGIFVSSCFIQRMTIKVNKFHAFSCDDNVTVLLYQPTEWSYVLNLQHNKLKIILKIHIQI